MKLRTLNDVLAAWESGAKVYYLDFRHDKHYIGAYDSDKVNVVSALFFRQGIKFGVDK